MVLNNKAISPVVATALLLVVAVVAVVGFQTWFNSYQSDQLVDVEDKSGDVGGITIERLENGTSQTARTIVYVKNKGTTDVTVSSVKVGATCDNSSFTATASTVTAMSLNGDACIVTQDSSYNVVVVTANGVVSGKYLAR
jgi:flagellin-like protein